jgi:hypothetical protein
VRGAEYVMLSAANRVHAGAAIALLALWLGIAHAEEFSGKVVALAALLADGRVMGAVWGRRRAWNFPFGRGAKGGKFV